MVVDTNSKTTPLPKPQTGNTTSKIIPCCLGNKFKHLVLLCTYYWRELLYNKTTSHIPKLWGVWEWGYNSWNETEQTYLVPETFLRNNIDPNSDQSTEWRLDKLTATIHKQEGTHVYKFYCFIIQFIATSLSAFKWTNRLKWGCLECEALFPHAWQPPRLASLWGTCSFPVMNEPDITNARRAKYHLLAFLSMQSLR